MVPIQKNAPSFEDIAAPVFTPEMGNRMRHMRMRLLMDQAELGRRLGGLAQTTISDLEKGVIRVPKKPFTLTQFKAVFGNLTSHILFGTGEDRFNYGFIREQYWKHKQRRIKKGESDEQQQNQSGN